MVLGYQSLPITSRRLACPARKVFRSIESRMNFRAAAAEVSTPGVPATVADLPGVPERVRWSRGFPR